MVVMAIVESFNQLPEDTSGVHFSKFLDLHQLIEQLPSFAETMLSGIVTLQPEIVHLRLRKCRRFL